jgi:hypothetical protein
VSLVGPSRPPQPHTLKIPPPEPDRPPLATVKLQPPPGPVVRPPPPRARPQRRLVATRPGKTTIHGIGFRPAEGGTVVVRSDRAVEYTVDEAEREVLLKLPGASIPLANNRRPLDTSAFGGVVERVLPEVVPGGVQVRVELKERMGCRVQQSGAVLLVTFVPAS